MKPLHHGKSRLAVTADLRQALSLAMALDTIAGVSASPAVGQVYVVSTDRTVQQRLGDTVHVLSREPAGGLNAAFGYGLMAARCNATDSPVALMMADLPAIRPREVSAALDYAGRTGRVRVLADASGTGTSVLCVALGAAVTLRFGGHSFIRHVADGATPISTLGLQGIRQDVDDIGNLRTAITLGVGCETRRVLSSHRLGQE
ncbi:MAG: 2-phospho-L-lactate guanylyltransferase, partial [Gemmatimonadaceae bacterium]